MQSCYVATSSYLNQIYRKIEFAFGPRHLCKLITLFYWAAPADHSEFFGNSIFCFRYVGENLNVRGMTTESKKIQGKKSKHTVGMPTIPFSTLTRTGAGKLSQ